MNIENLEKAYDKLNKYTINDSAIKELNILTKDLKVTVSNESLTDKILNIIDKRRIILEKKADIINSLYSDYKFAEDIVKDFNSKCLPINISKYAITAGLVGYTGYTYLVHRSPFLKLPGLLISLIGVHSIYRKITNDILEKKVDRAWKIHSYRLSKGLGPTNVKDEKHSELYNIKKQLLEKDSDYDYLYKNNQDEEHYSIYKRMNKSSKLRPYQFESKDTNLVAYDYNILNNSNKFLKGTKPYEIITNNIINKRLENNNNDNYNLDEYSDIQKKLYPVTFRMPTIYQPNYKVARNTIEAKYSEENSNQKDIVNLRNEFDNVIEFSDNAKNLPEYEKFINILNTSDEINRKLAFDTDINKDLANLKKKVHYLKQLECDDNDILKEINKFNNYVDTKYNEFIEKEGNFVKDIIKDDKVLIFNNEDTNHLKLYYNFLKSNEIKFIKNKDSYEEYNDFDFEIKNDSKYDPWNEYKSIYSDLLLKGRRYFIIKSIPEWKFLQIRKPTPKRIDEKLDKTTIVKNTHRMDDSIFQIWSLERWHAENRKKDNIHHQENTTHRI